MNGILPNPSVSEDFLNLARIRVEMHYYWLTFRFFKEESFAFHSAQERCASWGFCLPSALTQNTSLKRRVNAFCLIYTGELKMYKLVVEILVPRFIQRVHNPRIVHYRESLLPTSFIAGSHCWKWGDVYNTFDGQRKKNQLCM
jgi:hypothetical protein